MATGSILVRGTLALACLAGCNQIFGLDPAQQGPGDAGDATEPDGADAIDALDGPPAIDAVDALNPLCTTPGGSPNEDSDEWRDECDNCPHIYQPAGDQDDTDHDGVGDRCDPRPGRPDRLVIFHNFEDVSISYTPLSGDSNQGWSIGGDRLNITDGRAGVDYLARFPLNADTAAIATQITINAVPGGEVAPYHHSAGVWVNIDTASVTRQYPRGLVYELVDLVPQTLMARQFTRLADTSTGVPLGMNSGDDDEMWIPAPRVYQLLLSCDAVAGSCRGTTWYNNNVEATVYFEPLGFRLGAVGLSAHGASVTFDYVAIYTAQ